MCIETFVKFGHVVFAVCEWTDKKRTYRHAHRNASHPFESKVNSLNKTQSATADFAPGAAIWRTRRNILVVLDAGPFAPLRDNMTSSTKPEVHNVTGNVHRKFGEIRTFGFKDMRADRQTNRQTDRQTYMQYTQTHGSQSFSAVPYRGQSSD